MAWIKRGCLIKFWNADDIRNLKFEVPLDSTVGFELLDTLDNSRYQHKMSANLYRGLPNILSNPILESSFSFLANKSYAVHKILPGYILPLHRDRYAFYKNQNHIVDINSIIRVIVFLEDKKPGHILEIENTVVDSWVAGDWIAWRGSALHLAANIGNEDRYTLQITGTLNDSNYS